MQHAAEATTKAACRVRTLAANKLNMKMHLTFSQLPELRQLSSTERKQVYGECIHPILMSWPARVIKLLFNFGIFMGAFHLGFADSVMGFSLFMIVYLLADHLVDVAMVTCMRTQLRVALAKKNLETKTQKGEQDSGGNGG